MNFSDPFGLCKGRNGEQLPPEQCKKNLVGAQDAAMANPAFQPAANGQTFCNQATIAVISSMNESTSGLVDASGRALNANGIAAGLASSPAYMAVSAAEASRLANSGELVISAWSSGSSGHGHVSTLRPEPDRNAPAGGSGPLHADVGATVGIKRFTQTYGRSKQSAVKYYTPIP